jgi:NADPH2:quinone reductase
LGADHAINYRTQDFAAEVLRITDKRGVDVVLDMVAGGYLARELGCMAEDGRLVLIAVQGGVQAQVDAGVLMRKRLTVTGSTLRPRPIAFKAEIARSLRRQAWPWLEAGRVKPVIYRQFPAEQAAQAHTLMESNEHIGKLVLTW